MPLESTYPCLSLFIEVPSTTSLTTGALAERSFVERFLEDKSRSLVPFWGILIRIVAIWGVIFY